VALPLGQKRIHLSGLREPKDYCTRGKIVLLQISEILKQQTLLNIRSILNLTLNPSKDFSPAIQPRNGNSRIEFPELEDAGIIVYRSSP
jgi:hypothetical protein